MWFGYVLQVTFIREEVPGVNILHMLNGLVDGRGLGLGHLGEVLGVVLGELRLDGRMGLFLGLVGLFEDLHRHLLDVGKPRVDLAGHDMLVHLAGR